MNPVNEVVFLFDVDNTLLDNDRVVDDLRTFIARFGPGCADRYWTIFAALRAERGYADYLGALESSRQEAAGGPVDDPSLQLIAAFLLRYPFVRRIYPDAVAALAHCRQRGPTVLLTDGEAAFQTRKIKSAGLWEPVAGRVLIYAHKEQMLADVEQHFPSRHYVMVDDKLQVLTAMKTIWRERLTTIFPRQGQYALDPASVAEYPEPDLTLERIGDLCKWDLQVLLGSAGRLQDAEQELSEAV